MLNVYQARHKGRDFCNQTEGENHYKEGGVEPLDLMIAKDIIEDFCLGSMLKYAGRFKKTRNLKDLVKVSDYAQILCGVELDKREAKINDSSVACSKQSISYEESQALRNSNSQGSNCVRPT